MLKNSTQAFEKSLVEAAEAHYELCLYVAGSTARSLSAIQNITQLCEGELAGHYRLDVVDVYRQPERAVEDQIIAIPTLVKRAPAPAKKLIGDLSESANVRRQLGLARIDGNKSGHA